MKRVIVIFLSILSLNAIGQVGIDNPSPDPKASLDMKATDKGVLIPRMLTSERLALASGSPEGLFVYDISLHAFYYFYNGDWLCITPWTLKHNTAVVPQNMVVNTSLVDAVGINTAPLIGEKLAVGGKMRVDNTLTTNGLVGQSTVAVAGTGTFNTSDDTKKFSTYGTAGYSGPVPPGGIIVWFGAETGYFDINGLGTGKLTGWAMCNGKNNTPDLRDRFIVGAGTGSSYSIGSTGGANTVTLTVDGLPSHNHSGSTSTNGNHNHTWQHGHETDDSGSGGSYDEFTMIGGSNSSVIADAGNHSHTLNIDPAGGGGAHENRPPYYALIYMMKL